MELQNRQFETASAQTIKTLDRLKTALKLPDAGKGLEDVNAQARRMDFSTMSRALDTVGSRFTNMGIVGMTVLQNLTNKAVDAGTKLGKALTIDPVQSGLREYELKIDSIQSIMTNTAKHGTTMDDVNQVLGELNEYSDKTIYNFAEMTKNIGLFTAAGVELDTAAQSIKGISNLAAGVGADNATNARVMYQMSQAMSKGFMGLEDYNSLGVMGGDIFRDAAIKAGEMAGVIQKGSINAQNFRDSLKDGWLNLEVMSATWTSFAEDDALTAAATEVKTFTQLFGTLEEALGSGWAQSWELIIGDFEQAKAMFTDINDVLSGMIGASAEARNEVLSVWQDLGGRDKLIEAFALAFDNLVKIGGAIKKAWTEVFPPTTGKDMMNLTEGFYDIVKALTPSEDLLKIITNTLSIFFQVLKMGLDIVVGFGGELFEFFGGREYDITSLADATATIRSFLHTLRSNFNVLDFFGGLMDTVRDKLTATGETIKEFFSGGIFSTISTYMTDLFNTLTGELTFEGFNWDVVNGILVGGLTGGVMQLVKTLKGIFTGKSFDLGGIVESVTGVLDGAGDSLEAWQQNLKSDSIMNIAKALGILAISLLVLSLIPADKLESSLVSIGALFAGLVAALKGMTMFSKSAMMMPVVASAMILLSTAVLILAAAMAIMSAIDIEKALLGLAGTFGILIIAAKMLAKVSAKLTLVAPGLMMMATSILILSAALAIVSLIPTEKLITSLGALGAMMLAFALIAKMVGGTSLITAGVGMVLMAGAIAILAGALLIISMMSLDKMTVSVLVLAETLGLMVVAVLILDKLNPLAAAAGLVLIAVAMTIMAGALLLMGSMSLEAIGKGLLALAGSLLILGIAMHAMKTGIAGAAAMVVMAIAIAILVPSLLLLGAMDIKSIGSMLLALVGVFAVFGIAALLLGPLTPVILALSGALVLLGVATLAVGAGISLLAAGFAVLAGAGGAGIAVIISAVVSLINLIPLVIIKLGEGIVAIIELLAVQLPVIVNFILSFVAELLDGLVEYFPRIVLTLIELIILLLDALTEQTPKFITAAVEFVVALAEGLISAVPRLVTAAFDMILEFINALGLAIEEYTPLIIAAIFDLGGSIIKGLVDGLFAAIGSIGSAIADIGSSILDGLKSALGINSPSKETAEMGKYLDEGLIVGMEKHAKDVNKASEALGDQALDGLESSISRMNNGIPMDVTPTVSLAQPTTELGNFQTAMSGTFDQVAKMEGTIRKEETINVVASGTMKVEGVNNQNELVGVVNQTLNADAFVNQMRRDMRK